MITRPRIAVVGATGLVGNEMVVVLEQLAIPFASVRLFASKDSVGEVYKIGSEEAVVEELAPGCFSEIDIALFATSAELSKEYVPQAVAAGAIAIDNSSFFRMDPSVPLVVPEVNWSAVTPQNKIIANPNCSTIQLMPVLKTIHELAGLKRVVVSTYQSVSGAGKLALDELWSQTLGIFNQKEQPSEIFPHQIAFNCIPQVDTFLDSGYTKEEMKVVNESRKILGLPKLRITATAVRVPVLYSHAESVNVETERALSPIDLIRALEKQRGISVYAEPDSYPLQVQVAGTDEIHVGRIRSDDSVEHGLDMWVVADNVRKGAALNAVQIVERLIAQQ